MNIPELEQLATFRHHLYCLFGRRRDALFEALDALLTVGPTSSPAHLSLAPVFRRGWGSLYDALAVGQIASAAVEPLLAAYPLAAGEPVYAVDVSAWARCDAETSPGRAYYYHPSRHSAGQPIVAGWAYQWLAQLSFAHESWTAPLSVRRLTPADDSNILAAQQIKTLLQRLPRSERVPIFVFDAGYDSVELALSLGDARAAVLVRLRAGRCFYANPTHRAETGRPPRHGQKFVCADPTTWLAPTDEYSTDDPQYGQVRVRAWTGLHARPQNHASRGTRGPRPVIPGTLILVEVSRLPRPTRTPKQLWLWWHGP